MTSANVPVKESIRQTAASATSDLGSAMRAQLREFEAAISSGRAFEARYAARDLKIYAAQAYEQANEAVKAKLGEGGE